MAAFEDFVKNIVKKMISEDYPHMELPATMYAQITSGKETMITNEKTGERATWYEYTLAILDRFGSVDESFPLLPQVRSKKQFRAKAVVSVAFVYGDIVPTIIEEVLL